MSPPRLTGARGQVSGVGGDLELTSFNSCQDAGPSVVLRYLSCMPFTEEVLIPGLFLSTGSSLSPRSSIVRFDVSSSAHTHLPSSRYPKLGRSSIRIDTWSSSRQHSNDQLSSHTRFRRATPAISPFSEDTASPSHLPHSRPATTQLNHSHDQEDEGYSIIPISTLFPLHHSSHHSIAVSPEPGPAKPPSCAPIHRPSPPLPNQPYPSPLSPGYPFPSTHSPPSSHNPIYYSPRFPFLDPFLPPTNNSRRLSSSSDISFSFSPHRFTSGSLPMSNQPPSSPSWITPHENAPSRHFPAHLKLRSHDFSPDMFAPDVENHHLEIESAKPKRYGEATETGKRRNLIGASRMREDVYSVRK
jgi:hypothetical protein